MEHAVYDSLNQSVVEVKRMLAGLIHTLRRRD